MAGTASARLSSKINVPGPEDKGSFMTPSEWHVLLETYPKINDHLDLDKLCGVLTKEKKVNTDTLFAVYHYAQHAKANIKTEWEDQLKVAVTTSIAYRIRKRLIGQGPPIYEIKDAYPTQDDSTMGRKLTEIDGITGLVNYQGVDFENGAFSARNLPYDFLTTDPFEISREPPPGYGATIPTDEEYQAIILKMEEWKAEANKGLKTLKKYLEILGYNEFMFNTAWAETKELQAFQGRAKWSTHALWKDAPDNGIPLPDDIEKIDFKIGALLSLLPETLCPDEYQGVLKAPTRKRINAFLVKHTAKKPKRVEEVIVLEVPTKPREQIDTDSEDETEEVPGGITASTSVQQGRNNQSITGIIVPWAPKDNRSVQDKKTRMEKVQAECAELFSKGPRTHQIWLKGKNTPVSLCEVQANSRTKLKLRQVQDLIPNYDSRDIKNIIKFADKCARAFQNGAVEPLDLDEVITTRLEDTEAEKLWYEQWRATNPSERQDFDTAFKRRFLPTIDYNQVMKKCMEFSPENRTTVMEVGNELRKAVRPYIRLLQNPVEQLQAEKALLATFRNLIGPMWSFHLSVGECTDLDEAIEALNNYKAMNPGDSMLCFNRRVQANHVMVDKQEKGSKNEGQSRETVNNLSSENKGAFNSRSSMKCDSCGKEGHTISRCISLALKQGKKTPDGYKCKKCGALQEHLFSNCPQGDKAPKEQAPSPINGSKLDKMQCYRCQGFGHFSRDCPSQGKGRMPVEKKETTTVQGN